MRKTQFEEMIAFRVDAETSRRLLEVIAIHRQQRKLHPNPREINRTAVLRALINAEFERLTADAPPTINSKIKAPRAAKGEKPIRQPGTASSLKPRGKPARQRPPAE